jgi:Zn-dependent protease with chaperone function
MNRRIGWFVVGAFLLCAAGPPVAVAEDEQQEDKAEKERRKREEKALEKQLKEAQEKQSILDEIQPDIDQKVMELRDRLYRDRFLQDYINEVGQSLVPKETPSGVLFIFRVEHNPMPEAFAFPDGRIYVTSGLLSFVESEAELGVVLGHEIGHVLENHTIEAIRESRSVKRRLLPGLLGGAAGAILGGVVKGKEGAAIGAAAGAAAGLAMSAIDFKRYGRKQEDEADTIGVRLALTRGYDAKEGVTSFERLADRFGDKDPLSNFLYAKHSRNVDRVRNIRALLDGDLATVYNERLAGGELSLGTGQLQLFSSRMVRDVAVFYMEEMDRYDIAKGLLGRIADYRMRDPKTLWALGRLYKGVGRTAEERARALDYLQRAALLDERNRYPEIWRDLGLMQARMAEEGQMAPAIESLKKYVVGFEQRYVAEPADLDEMYDYLLIFGDSKWLAPPMESQVLRAAAPAPPASGPRQGVPTGSKAAVPTPAKKKGGS